MYFIRKLIVLNQKKDLINFQKILFNFKYKNNELILKLNIGSGTRRIFF